MNFIIEPGFPAIGAVGFDPVKKKVFMILQREALLDIHGNKSLVEDVAALTEHECGHVLFEHIFNFDKSNNQMLMNVAQDMIINDCCHFIISRPEIHAKDSKSILAKGCFFKNAKEKYPVLKDADSKEITSVQLYKILKEQAEKEQKDKEGQGDGEGQKGQGGPGEKGEKGQGQPGSGMPNGLGEPFDSHEQYEISEDADGNEVIKKTDKQNSSKQEQEMASELKSIVGEAIQQLDREGLLNKAIGQLSGQIQMGIKSMIRSRTDKNSVFQFFNSLPISMKRKWTKLHRRYPYLAKGKRTIKKPKLVMVIDTSGSMGGDTLFGMIQHQCEVLVSRCEQLWIVVGDTQLEYSVFVKHKSQFTGEMIQFAGGGGTNMQFGWDFAKEHDLDGVIMHTDGHIGNFDDHGLETIFYLYGEGCHEQDGYQNVRVYPE
jgi:predicted metal-dependent peptidase